MDLFKRGHGMMSQIWPKFQNGRKPLKNMDEIRRSVAELAAKIAAPSHMLPLIGESDHTGRPHIEIKRTAYHYVVCERGSEHSRATTEDFDELLFWIFESITFGMASDWECANRKSGEDFRRQLFSKQLDLLGEISGHWRNRLLENQAETLLRYPLSDGTYETDSNVH